MGDMIAQGLSSHWGLGDYKKTGKSVLLLIMRLITSECINLTTGPGYNALAMLFRF